MEQIANLGATPKRHRILRERQLHSDTRRSLFDKGDSDLSDISPLSRTSSELFSPDKSSPMKIVSPLRLRGIGILPPDRGIITPTSFYGRSNSARIPTDGAEMYRQIRKSLPEISKARTCLFLDDLPRNKKRPRSSGNPNKSVKQVRKQIKLQPNLRHDVRKPSKSEIRQREILKRKKEMKKLKEHRLKEKLNQGKRKYNWEIFNTHEDLQKFTWRSSVVMTPPHSTKKKRLMPTNLTYLSPTKVKCSSEMNEGKELETEENKVASHDELVKEIREGVLDMMKDDEEDDVSREVGVLLDSLDKCGDIQESEEIENNMKSFNIDKEVENNDPKTPPKDKLFPIFSNTPQNSSSLFSSPITMLESSSCNKKKFGVGLDQLQLDVGQNKLREIECTGCGLIYIQGNPEDMEEHEIFHFKYKELHFNGWKNERVVRFDGTSKIVCVRDSDTRQWWKKASNVLDVIDSELGYPPNGPSPTQIYLYVSGKFIKGIAAISHTSKAYKMLHVEGSDDVGLCSEEEYSVKCLISRIWVDKHIRRCNIASTLLDSVRSNFSFGSILKCSDLAFTSPTEDGRKFIETYTKTKEYFVHA